jgi:NADH:ubiquinone oxidoreductase subunit D
VAARWFSPGTPVSSNDKINRKQPAEQAKQPAEQAKQSAEQAKQPAEQAKQPAEQTKKPAEQAKQPCISHVISTQNTHISPRAEGPRSYIGQGLI